MNEKVDCLIQDYDWERTPTSFNYKLTEDDEKKIGSIDLIKEFGIEDKVKYIRYKGKIDRSSNRIENLSNTRSPEFQEEMLFLKVLIEGNAGLFVYNDADLERFFFNINNSEIEPLVYKSYAISTNHIGENVTYKQQLINGLKCKAISDKQITTLNYDKNSLCKLFSNYNECTSNTYHSFENKIKKSSNSITLRPGLNYTSIDVVFGSHRPGEIDFGGSLSYRMGGEFETLLPFRNGVWAIIIEPYLQLWNHKAQNAASVLDVKYSSFNVSMGLRRYIPLKEKNKIFINASMNYDIPFNSTFVLNYINPNNAYDREDYKKTIDTHKISLNAGLGCKINKRYSAEINYLFRMNLLHTLSVHNVADCKTISLILGYKLFGKK